MQPFTRSDNLPPYIFGILDEIRIRKEQEGCEIFDFGMGNPDQPPAQHIIEALVEGARRSDTHRYSASRGITKLREAICAWYQRRYQVQLDPDQEAIATIGSKDGLAHLSLAVMGPGDVALVPAPCYPIHMYSFIIAGATVLSVPMQSEAEFLIALEAAITEARPKPKMLVLNFPSNPTAHCVELDFFEKIIKLAKYHEIWVVHDLAYADINFDGYTPPSILQVPGAKDIAVESYSLSKSYNMAGWRVGFLCGNARLVQALQRLKSYLDYGSFTPIQLAAVAALEGPQDCIQQNCEMYCKRRDVLCDGLMAIGWSVEKPKATMFVWAKIPDDFKAMGSLAFAKALLEKTGVVVSPGIGFGEYGDDHVRFSLILNEECTTKAISKIEAFLKKSIQG